MSNKASITLTATARVEYTTTRDLDVVAKNLEAAMNAAELEGLITDGCEAELAGIDMETKDDTEQWWTVVLLIPRSKTSHFSDTYTVQQSGTMEEAVRKARADAEDENGWKEGEHKLAVVGLFPGEHLNEAAEFMDAEENKAKV